MDQPVPRTFNADTTFLENADFTKTAATMWMRGDKPVEALRATPHVQIYDLGCGTAARRGAPRSSVDIGANPIAAGNLRVGEEALQSFVDSPLNAKAARCRVFGAVPPAAGEQAADLAISRPPIASEAMVLRSMIVSAQPESARQMGELLADLPCVELVATVSDGRSALTALASDRIDLVFLDAELPRFEGLGLADFAGGAMSIPYLVLIAAEEALASRAFDLGATDFLTKPIRMSRLETAVARVARAKRLAEAETQFAQAGGRGEGRLDHGDQRPSNDLWVQRRGERIRIDLHRVHRLVAEGEYVRLFVDGADYLHREALTAIMARLDSAKMIRIHRSFAVAWSEITAIRRQNTGSYEAVLRDGTRLPIGRTYRAEVRSLAIQIRS